MAIVTSGMVDLLGGGGAQANTPSAPKPERQGGTTLGSRAAWVAVVLDRVDRALGLSRHMTGEQARACFRDPESVGYWTRIERWADGMRIVPLRGRRSRRVPSNDGTTVAPRAAAYGARQGDGRRARLHDQGAARARRGRVR